jgi:hypothetical protein
MNLLRTAEKKLEVAGNRWQANHDKAHAEHKKAVEAERKEAKAQREGHPKLAEAESAKAARCHHRAWKASERAQYFVRKAKEYAAEVHDLKETIETKEGKLRKLEAEHGPHIDPDSPNKVVGGTAKERLKFAMHYSELHGSQFYSQVGASDVKHGLTGPSAGHRHDCSSWFTSMYWSCGLPDPNGGPEGYVSGETMFTGTLGEHGKPISEGELDTGDAILYGFAPFHHIEMKDGPMSEGPWTVGHGSSPIDRGVVALLPGPRAYRRYPKE